MAVGWGWGALGQGTVGHRCYEREKMDGLTEEVVNTGREVRKDK